MAVVFAQGGDMHFLDGASGLKDFDVWTFYAAIPNRPMRCGRYETHADFGPSSHGRQKYPAGFDHPQLTTWLGYAGRRVDFMVRDLTVDVDVRVDEVTTALQAWLATGSGAKADRSGERPSSWHLSRKR